MKKVLLMFSLMLMTACSYSGKVNTSDCDSTQVDTIEVVDTLTIDSLAVDSIN